MGVGSASVQQGPQGPKYDAEFGAKWAYASKRLAVCFACRTAHADRRDVFGRKPLSSQAAPSTLPSRPAPSPFRRHEDSDRRLRLARDERLPYDHADGGPSSDTSTPAVCLTAASPACLQP